MFSFRNTFAGALVGGLALVASSAAFALPSLQLGPGSGNWAYDNSTQTWFTSDSPFNVSAFANDDGTGANGAYAWDSAGAGAQIGYIVFAATPMSASGDGDVFNISVANDGGSLTLHSSGYGAPPLEDTNSLAPHGIYDTYFEIYEFNFDGGIVTISDQQPGQSGSGDGFIESFDVTINSLDAGVTGLHMDLFVVEGDGDLDNATIGNSAVNSFAPFSHDGEFFDIPGCQDPPCRPPFLVSEPGPLAALGFGLLVLGYLRRRQNH